ncbi:unnamed protein product, partial [Brassica rapa]
TRTATDVLCVLTDTHRHTRTATDVLCVLTDTHGRPVCADGHTRTHTQTNTDSHGRPVCAEGQPLTATTFSVCWRTPTDVICVLNRQPTWAKITQTVHGMGQRAESKDQLHGKGQRAESMDQRADMCTDGQTRTSCVLTDTDGHTRTHTDSQGRHVCTGGHPRTQPTWAKITRTVHGRGQPAESKDQRADIVLSPRTNMLVCVLIDSQGRPACADGHTGTHTDSHGRPVCADGHTRISSTDVLCVLVDTHGRYVCTEQTAHDQRADMCTDGQPRTSCAATDVLCVLADTHRRHPTWAKITRTVHGKGQCAESKDKRADIQPTWAKITRTVLGKGQCADFKDQRADMCTDGQPRTSSTNVADTNRRPVCTEQTSHVDQNHPNA